MFWDKVSKFNDKSENYIMYLYISLLIIRSFLRILLILIDIIYKLFKNYFFKHLVNQRNIKLFFY